MRKTIIMASIAAVLSVAGGQAIAKEKGPAGSAPNPFVDCGIGAAIFPTVGWAAAVSNALWDLGTTAIISATASPETCNAKKREVAQFILDNYDQLAEETARGEGEHLNAMFDIVECGSVDEPAMVSSLRTKMSDIVSDTTYQKSDSISKSSSMFNALDTALREQSADECAIS